MQLPSHEDYDRGMVARYWLSCAEYQAYVQRQAEQRATEGKVKPPGKKQVRLPVVVVQPDDDVQYGRAESRFFPQRQNDEKQGPDRTQDAQLPDTPPKGAYYIQGYHTHNGVLVYECQNVIQSSTTSTLTLSVQALLKTVDMWRSQ